mgnify:CR=1 FL=1
MILTLPLASMPLTKSSRIRVSSRILIIYRYHTEVCCFVISSHQWAIANHVLRLYTPLKDFLYAVSQDILDQYFHSTKKTRNLNLRFNVAGIIVCHSQFFFKVKRTLSFHVSLKTVSRNPHSYIYPISFQLLIKLWVFHKK